MVEVLKAERCGGRFEFPDEAVVKIKLGVELIAKVGFGVFLRPRAVLAPPASSPLRSAAYPPFRVQDLQ